MTYCVALRLNAGLVMLSDTRTNAGVDDIAKFRKMFAWNVPGDRAFVLMTAGNLAITQSVISLLQERIDNDDGNGHLYNARSIYRMAELIGDAMREVQERFGPGLRAMNESTLASIVLAGQVQGGDPRLFMIYAAGNFIEATEDTPFFQIGSHKYGKPILDRVIEPETTLNDGITAALLSMDSTLRSDLTVGMPLDLAVLPNGAFEFSIHRRIESDDPSFRALSDAWSMAIRDAFVKMREIPK
ncbi:MAG: proteasome-type protease [Pseudomonadota bacterium]